MVCGDGAGGRGRPFAKVSKQAWQSARMGIHNLLFFMASLPISRGVLRASASAPTGAWSAAKVPLVGRRSPRGTETAKHFS